MAYNIIKENKARCKKCGELLISKTSKGEEVCACGSLKIGGGHSWIKRSGKVGVDYDELAILNFEHAPENIKES